jgi:hypothetical protein
MMWARCAAAGRAEMSSMHVCVECTHLPFGRRATMGMSFACMLVMGAAVIRK